MPFVLFYPFPFLLKMEFKAPFFNGIVSPSPRLLNNNFSKEPSPVAMAMSSRSKPGRSTHALPIAKAASSPSPSIGLGSSASDYSEQLLGPRTRRKKRSVAGVDQDELLDPRHLADPDSSFCEYLGVHVHYKTCEEEAEAEARMPIRLPMILLHGFGASVFSWNRVMKPLANLIGSKVLAFDRPAFGLTSRISPSANDTKKPLNPYSMAFSVLTTLYFIGFLESDKAVLVGHSAGALTAIGAYFEAPECVAALILVAPAVLAPSSARKETRIQESSFASGSPPNLFVKLYQYIVSTIMPVFRSMINVARLLYTKAISAVLRSALAVMLVRFIIDKFGVAAIRNSWYDASQVTEDILHGYTKPLRTKDWDKALIEYTAAMLLDSAPDSKPSVAKRLHQIVCPVLIITGDTDRLVPAWNAERLARVIPGSQLEVIKNCGHLPHEEKPEEFIAIVGKFLQKVLGGSTEFSLQASV